MYSSKIIVWRFTDGKVGHEKQSQALIESLQEQLDIESVDIPVKHSQLYYLVCYLLKRKISNASTTRTPSLVLGAGHGTHLPLLAARRYFRCKSIVIMRPSLPSKLFDVIVAPSHDYIDKITPQNVVTTPAALAPKIESQPIDCEGLILLGGESKHYNWDSKKITDQIQNIIESSSDDIFWQLTTSRRTPKSTIEHIKKSLAKKERLSILRYQDIEKEWLSKALETAGNIWVTPDSASMIAEALMTKAPVGLIDLVEKNKNGKISKANRELVNQGYLKNSTQPGEFERKKIDIKKTTNKIIKLLEL